MDYEIYFPFREIYLVEVEYYNIYLRFTDINIMDSEIKVESILNQEGDKLPFAYFNPDTEGKLTWICGEDAEGKITSAFCYDQGTHKEKKCDYLDSKDKAIEVRNELIEYGWKKLIPPEITFKYPGDKEPRKLNRKQKRALAKKIKHINNKNPFRK